MAKLSHLGESPFSPLWGLRWVNGIYWIRSVLGGPEAFRPLADGECSLVEQLKHN